MDKPGPDWTPDMLTFAQRLRGRISGLFETMKPNADGLGLDREQAVVAAAWALLTMAATLIRLMGHDQVFFLGGAAAAFERAEETVADEDIEQLTGALH